MKRPKTGALVLLCTLFTLMLVHCADRVNLNHEIDLSDKEVDVSFSAGFDGFGTRAYPTELSKIRKHRVNFDNLRIVFYHIDPLSDKPTKVAYAFDKLIRAEKGVFSGKDLTYQNNDSEEDFLGFEVRGADKIAVGDYEVYIFASPNSAIKLATEVGKSFSELSESMSYDDSDFPSYYLKNNLYFTPEPINVTSQMLNKVSYGEVYRMPTAKLSALNALVSVEWNAKVKDPEYEILSDRIFFYIDVQNKRFDLFPQEDKSLQDAGLDLYYPIDSNYTGLKQKSMNELNKDFLYLDYLNGSSNIALHTASHSSDREDVYRAVPENTLAASDAYGHLVTRVIFKVNMIPVSLKEHWSDSEKSSYNVTWVSYDSEPYIYSDFVKLYNDVLEKGTAQTDKERAMIKEASNFVNLSEPSALPTVGYNGDLVKLYVKGEAYFAIPITHFSMTQLHDNTELPGHYGVVRNHHYVLKVNSFRTVGKPTAASLTRDIDYRDLNKSASSSVHVTDMTEIITSIDDL